MMTFKKFKIVFAASITESQGTQITTTTGIPSILQGFENFVN